MRSGSVWLVFVFGVAACTEPNPFLSGDSDDEGSDSGGSTMAATASGTTAMSTSSSSASDGTTDPTTSGEVTTTMSPTDATDTTTTPESCEGGYTCVPEAPVMWNGPVAIAVAAVDAVPGCEGDFPTLDSTVFDGLAGPTAECDCDCSDPTLVNCDQPTLEYHTNDMACGSPDDTWDVASGCTMVSGSSGDYWQVARPGVVGGSCSPSATESFPEVSWGYAVRSCGGAFGSEGCDAGSLCARVPDVPFERTLCIWSEGEGECPEGSVYDQRTVYYTDYDDTRDCGPCSCDDPEGECTGVVRTFQSGTCTTLTNSFTVGAACHLGTSGAVGSARWEEDTLTASCAPSPPDPTGDVAPLGPRVFCCYDPP